MSIGLMQERPPFVRFTVETAEDRNASLAAGRYIARDVDMVNITPAGSKDVVIRNAEEWLADIQFRARKNPPEYNPTWAEHFASSYRAFKEGNELPALGTPVRTWPVASPAQVKNLISARLMTVEDLAVANESALNMIGMGARDLKNKAIAWLEQSKGAGVVVQEVADLKAKVDAMQAQIDEQNEVIAEQDAKLRQTKDPKGRRQPTSLAERAASLRDERDVV